ncbi:helix-turn-helix domain-containing protein [Amorphus orientalis]|uniref:AraC-like DNA-binding protein n=1 Tax=Amorphus orientalis TaxID=649198 RepID=A0AAE4AS42_9HYPH|nr:helix-turn-helix domain-containing protein [Amorphus orientalis]MDQ0314697.1 AraC-like DNA-binding protein [Amorphus orientalis]
MADGVRTDIHDSLGGVPGPVELRRRRPPPDLSAFCSGITFYRERFQGVARQLETATLTVPLIVSFGTPFEIGLGRPPGPEDRIRSFVAGPYAGPVHILSRGEAHCLQIDFTPLGARRVFGLPMDELTGRMVLIDDLDDAGVRTLADRLTDTPDWSRRFDIAERFVIERLGLAAPPVPEIAWAFAALDASHGSARIAALSADLGWSRRHFISRFRTEIGMSPKTVARLLRFAHAQRIARSTGTAWADTAAAAGYADQAHLIRDFREFSGLTPQAWLRTQPR